MTKALVGTAVLAMTVGVFLGMTDQWSKAATFYGLASCALGFANLGRI